jgi:hypothetical protein
MKSAVAAFESRASIHKTEAIHAKAIDLFVRTCEYHSQAEMVRSEVDMLRDSLNTCVFQSAYLD